MKIKELLGQAMRSPLRHIKSDKSSGRTINKTDNKNKESLSEPIDVEKAHAYLHIPFSSIHDRFFYRFQSTTQISPSVKGELMSAADRQQSNLR
ncbi:hypothetical protein GWI33_012521 [Rhynchophorus ferrugineus]|uniref:Uncharacterized protein n=1 Tax=Rhynchophorus ferrugineus TaxID=354439 RepID=A0A834IBG1_RHYFE|nr:hypothetical protein GWI33_012521 [Rhynchophorus ferrugineus]